MGLLAFAHGLTIYWPFTTGGRYNGYVGNELYNSTRDGQWDEFLQAFFAATSGGRGRDGMAANTGAVDRLAAPDSSSQSVYLPLISW